MNEIKKRYDKKTETNNYFLSNVPLNVSLTQSYGGVIITYNLDKSFVTYDGDLTEKKDFEKYKKEITALLKDFDDIFGEVNRKYNLKKEN